MLFRTRLTNKVPFMTKLVIDLVWIYVTSNGSSTEHSVRTCSSVSIDWKRTLRLTINSTHDRRKTKKSMNLLDNHHCETRIMRRCRRTIAKSEQLASMPRREWEIKSKKCTIMKFRMLELVSVSDVRGQSSEIIEGKCACLRNSESRKFDG